MRAAITNIGTIVSGDWRFPFVQGDTIITLGEKIGSVGTTPSRDVQGCEVVIDADGASRGAHVNRPDSRGRTSGPAERKADEVRHCKIP
jgi:hypothetical protein